jgi:hypothetical protein
LFTGAKRARNHASAAVRRGSDLALFPGLTFSTVISEGIAPEAEEVFDAGAKFEKGVRRFGSGLS